MSRPVCCRKVNSEPKSNYFKPIGIPLTLLEEIILTLDEFEAVRLADLEGLYQEQSAKKMNVSRQTFGRIIESAHRKIAEALINGKALKIEGGVVEMTEKYFVCSACKNEWTSAYGAGRPKECPQCKSTDIHRAPQDRGWAKQNDQGRHGRCRKGAVIVIGQNKTEPAEEKITGGVKE